MTSLYIRGDRRSALKIGKPSPVRLNMMVVGETGSGKTTFLKTLFKLYCGSKIIRAELGSKTTQTMKIEEIGSFTLGTNALDCEIHLFDSPGYGDCIDNSAAIVNVKSHLEHAHQSWLATPGNEMTEKARNAADGRIHCVFYFIAPHRIKAIDKAFLKQLAGLAPIVMVIAKADTMTWLERKDHLIAVRKLVDELEAECKISITFDFQEEDSGFLDAKNCTHADEPGDVPVVQALSSSSPTVSARDFLDLSPCLLDSEFGGEDPTAMYDARFTYNDRPYLPDEGAQQVHYPTRLHDDGEGRSSACLESKDPRDDREPASTELQHPVPTRLFEVSRPSSPSEHLAKSVHQPLPKIRNAFAVVCDTSEFGKREFPWGSVDIYNEAHSDFHRLQRLMFESDHIVRLRELTQEMSMKLNKPRSLADHLKVVKSIQPAVERATKTINTARETARVVTQAVNAIILFVAWVLVPMLLVFYLYFGDSVFRQGVTNLFSASSNAGPIYAPEPPIFLFPEVPLDTAHAEEPAATVFSAIKDAFTHGVHIDEHFSRCNAYTGYFGCGEVDTHYR